MSQRSRRTNANYKDISFNDTNKVTKEVCMRC